MTDTTALDREIAKFQSESDVAFKLLRKCVEENANSALDQTEYQKKHSALVEYYETAKTSLEKIADKKTERTIKRDTIIGFMKMLMVALFYATHGSPFSRTVALADAYIHLLYSGRVCKITLKY